MFTEATAMLALIHCSPAMAAQHDYSSAQGKLDFLEKFRSARQDHLMQLVDENGLTPNQVFYWALLQKNGYLAEWSADQKKNPAFIADMQHDLFYHHLYSFSSHVSFVVLRELQSEMLDVSPTGKSAGNGLLAQGTAFAEQADPVRPLLDLPEKKIDVGLAALIITKDMFPQVNIKMYSKKINKLVEGARKYVGGSTYPDARIRALNSYLFRECGYKYDFSDPWGKKLANRLLVGILDTKKGQCITMPLLYLVIAQRLGYPVHAVSAPDHMFLRYVDPGLAEQNIEATGGGGFETNKGYMSSLSIPARSVESGAYLKTLTNRELLGILIGGAGSAYYEVAGDANKAIRYWIYASELFPTDPTCRENLGNIYLTCAKLLSGAEAQRWQEKGRFYKAQAKELGVVVLPMEEYVEQVKKQALKEGIGGGAK